MQTCSACRDASRRAARGSRKSGSILLLHWRRLPCGDRSFAGSCANAMERRVDISFILHLVGILAPGLWLGRALRIPPPLHIGLTFLIFETSLVAGAGIRPGAGMLGPLPAYQFVTPLCSVAIAGGLWWLARSTPRPAG